ncbi:MAG: NrfD/PsrC family molybdoenzyme membrane anchor subunit [Cocleimonas sp.]
MSVSLKTSYSELENNGIGFWGIFSFFGLLLIGGVAAFNYMHHHGHYVTGMNNQIVWGIPHVFAIFLIVAASGAANIATIGTVFNKQTYQPLGRLSLLLAASLLIGGLLVLLLDLGSIGHVIEMAKGALNFQSIFAWNMILYSGFVTIIIVYLWTMMDRTKTAKSFYKPLGKINFIWRFILTMGTGSIFGVLLARQYYDVFVMGPLFIAASYMLGTAIYSLLLVTTFKLSQRDLGDVIIKRLRYSLPLFIVAVLVFELVRHLINIFVTEHHGIEPHILTSNSFSKLFWFGQILIGSVLPLFLLWSGYFKNNTVALVSSSILIIVGAFIQLYVIIIGGQSYPLVLFQNADISSSFADGVFNTYSGTLPEYLLGLGGIGLTFCMVLIGIKIFRMLPTSLAD